MFDFLGRRFAALPGNAAQQTNWKPWKSARTQWLNRNLDRHSRAYATLETGDAKTKAFTVTQQGREITTRDTGSDSGGDSSGGGGGRSGGGGGSSGGSSG